MSDLFQPLDKETINKRLGKQIDIVGEYETKKKETLFYCHNCKNVFYDNFQNLEKRKNKCPICNNLRGDKSDAALNKLVAIIEDPEIYKKVYDGQ